MSRTWITALGVLLMISLGVSARQATPVSPATAAATTPPAPQTPLDPLGRSSPYDTVVNFTRAADRGDFARAADYLDTRREGEAREDLARTLARLMNLGYRVDLDSLSRNQEGALDDGRRQTRESIGELRIDNDALELLLDRVQRATDPPIWLFSSETLADLQTFADAQGEIAAMWLETHLPRVLVETTVGGVVLYRWLSLPIFLLLALVMAWTVPKLLAMLLRAGLLMSGRRLVVLVETRVATPVRLLAFGLLLSLGERFGVTLMARYFWGRLATVILVAALTWLFLTIVDLSAEAFANRLRRTGSQHRIAAVELFRGAAKFVGVVVGVLAFLNLLGFDLTTAIAGVGIGGVAIAFAAQRTLENLFGTVMLVADQPIRVGDFCRAGDTLGTVETIGMRSTTIRTLGRTLVTVPNGQLVAMVLENFAPRDKVWLTHTIGLRYETTAEQLRDVLVRVRALLDEHPAIESSSARVRLVRFGGSSLDVEIFAYALCQDYAAFLTVQEDVLLRIIDVIEACGTALAFPSQTTYLAQDKGLDADKARAAIAQAQGATPPEGQGQP